MKILTFRDSSSFLVSIPRINTKDKKLNQSFDQVINYEKSLKYKNCGKFHLRSSFWVYRFLMNYQIELTFIIIQNIEVLLDDQYDSQAKNLYCVLS